MELRLDRGTVPLGGTKPRALLAMLALEVGQVVARDRLVDGLWGESPPAASVHTVESYVSRLRGILRDHGGDGVLRTRSPGYVLDLDPDEVDVRRFERLVREGRLALAVGESELAGRLLREGLELFRGPALDDVAFLPFAAAPVARLAEERLAAVGDRVDADLAAGREGECIGELQALVEAQPLHERAHAQLMLALYRVGRQSDALLVYRRAREHLREELGVEPGPALRDLEQAVLRHDPSLERRGVVQLVADGRDPARRDPRVRAVTQDSGLTGVAPSPEGPPTAANGEAGGATAPLLPAVREIRAGRRFAVAVVTLVLLVGATAVLRLVASHDGSSSATPSGRLGAASVGVLDARTGVLQGRLRANDDPGALVLGDKALWVADVAQDTLTRVDLVRRQATDTVQLPGDPNGVTSGGGSVWVAQQSGGTVSRISAQTDQVVQRVRVGRSPSGIAYADGAVWVTAADDRTLVEVDGRTGHVRQRIPLNARPTSVVSGFGMIWVSSEAAGAVYRIDPSGRDVVRIPVGTGPGPIAVDGSSVWVANTLDGTVSRIDPSRDVVTATVPTGAGADGLAAGPEGVWVADQADRDLVRVDGRSAIVTRTVPLGGSPQGLAYAGGSLWVSTGPAPALHDGGTLHVDAAMARLDSIDPGRAFLLFPPQLLGMTNDGLVTLKHVDGVDGTQVVPDLATTVPEPTDHGRSYRFALRAGIRYSDGRPVRPRDFRRALQRDFRIGSPGMGFYSDLVGAAACLHAQRQCRLTRGVTLDPTTRSVTFHLTHADADFLYKLTLTFADAVPRGTPDHDIGRQPVPATGPYRIAAYRPGRRLVLVRNPVFHEWSAAAQPDGKPDRIVWRFGLTPERTVSAVEHGAADYGFYSFPFSPPADRLTELRTRFPGQVHAHPLPETEFFTLNTRVPPFDDVRVRRALNDAVDRRVVARLDGGRLLASPTCQFLPPGLPGYVRDCLYTTGGRANGTYHGPRLTVAQRLVAASGTRGMRVRVVTSPHVPAARYVAGVLRRLGYRASVLVAQGDRLGALESNSRNRSQVNTVGWAADYPSPAEFLDYFLSCRSFHRNSDTNINTAEFCDQHLDDLIAHAQRLGLTDPVAAARVWRRADHRVADLAPVLPTVNLMAVDFVSPRVGGYEFNPQWGILLDQLWIR